VEEQTMTPSGETRPDLLTIHEAAARLACSPGALRKWMTKGLLQPVKLGRAVRLRAADVARAASEGIPAVPSAR
jgi:excisionase family DNA binding protein